jgi:hypothetical protein
MSNRVLELYAKIKGIPLKEAEKIKTRADLKKLEVMPIERKKELYLESGNTEEDFERIQKEKKERETIKKPEVRYRDGGEAVYERRTFTGKSRDFEDIKDSSVHDYITEKHDQLEAEQSWYRIYAIKGPKIEFIASKPTQAGLKRALPSLARELSPKGYGALVIVLQTVTLKDYYVGPYQIYISITPISDGKLLKKNDRSATVFWTESEIKKYGIHDLDHELVIKGLLSHKISSNIFMRHTRAELGPPRKTERKTSLKLSKKLQEEIERWKIKGVTLSDEKLTKDIEALRKRLEEAEEYTPMKKGLTFGDLYSDSDSEDEVPVVKMNKELAMKNKTEREQALKDERAKQEAEEIEERLAMVDKRYQETLKDKAEERRVKKILRGVINHRYIDALRRHLTANLASEKIRKQLEEAEKYELPKKRGGPMTTTKEVAPKKRGRPMTTTKVVEYKPRSISESMSTTKVVESKPKPKRVTKAQQERDMLEKIQRPEEVWKRGLDYTFGVLSVDISMMERLKEKNKHVSADMLEYAKDVREEYKEDKETFSKYKEQAAEHIGDIKGYFKQGLKEGFTTKEALEELMKKKHLGEMVEKFTSLSRHKFKL